MTATLSQPPSSKLTAHSFAQIRASLPQGKPTSHSFLLVSLLLVSSAMFTTIILFLATTIHRAIIRHRPANNGLLSSLVSPRPFRARKGGMTYMLILLLDSALFKLLSSCWNDGLQLTITPSSSKFSLMTWNTMASMVEPKFPMVNMTAGTLSSVQLLPAIEAMDIRPNGTLVKTGDIWSLTVGLSKHKGWLNFDPQSMLLHGTPPDVPQVLKDRLPIVVGTHKQSIPTELTINILPSFFSTPVLPTIVADKQGKVHCDLKDFYGSQDAVKSGDVELFIHFNLTGVEQYFKFDHLQGMLEGSIPVSFPETVHMAFSAWSHITNTRSHTRLDVHFPENAQVRKISKSASEAHILKSMTMPKRVWAWVYSIGHAIAPFVGFIGFMCLAAERNSPNVNANPVDRQRRRGNQDHRRVRFALDQPELIPDLFAHDDHGVNTPIHDQDPFMFRRTFLPPTTLTPVPIPGPPNATGLPLSGTVAYHAKIGRLFKFTVPTDEAPGENLRIRTKNRGLIPRFLQGSDHKDLTRPLHSVTFRGTPQRTEIGCWHVEIYTISPYDAFDETVGRFRIHVTE